MAKCNAAVPLCTAKENLMFRNLENFSSNILVFFPFDDSHVDFSESDTYFNSRFERLGLLIMYFILPQRLFYFNFYLHKVT